MNLTLLIFHIFLVGSLSLFFLRLGKEAMIAYLALLVVCANIFVHKQITLFGLSVTCSDALAVGYLLGSNLIQEYFGKEVAKKTIWISFMISGAFVVLSLLQLAYLPNSYDTTQLHFAKLLKPIPRITFASLFSFLFVQLLDLSFFNYLRKKTEGKFLGLRILISGILAHGLDTLLFSFLGLYGIVHSIMDVILFSFTIKLGVICLSYPFVVLSKRVVRVQV